MYTDTYILLTGTGKIISRLLVLGFPPDDDELLWVIKIRAQQKKISLRTGRRGYGLAIYMSIMDYNFFFGSLFA